MKPAEQPKMMTDPSKRTRERRNEPITPDAIVEYVRDRGNHVTFVEMMDHFGDAAKGDLAISLPDVPNVYLWAHLSEAFVAALEEARPRLDIAPSIFLVYLIDGGVLSWPIAKRATKRGYKKPHWAPVTLSVKP